MRLLFINNVGKKEEKNSGSLRFARRLFYAEVSTFAFFSTASSFSISSALRLTRCWMLEDSSLLLESVSTFNYCFNILFDLIKRLNLV